MCAAPVAGETLRQTSERMAERALKQLLEMLEGRIVDTCALLEMYEATHDDYELTYSKAYQALLTAQFGLEETKERIRKQLK